MAALGCLAYASGAMSQVRFVRCKHCGLPHEATVERCPFTGEEVVPASTVAEPMATLDARVGDRVADRYRLEAPVGIGGMGSVYRALDESKNQSVAIKLLPLYLYEERLVKRFTREVQAAAAVAHPNVVELFDAGAMEDGTPFLVMELVPGKSLQQRLREGVMPIDEALTITDQLLAALECAHAAGVVHRDIKPANVIVDGEGPNITVKMLDFGLSKLVMEQSSLTRTGEILGTPHYVAPEQARGAEIDGRADLWSVGVVLYEMLAGDTPFGEGPVARVLMRVLSAEPEPVSKLRDGVSAELDEFVLRALQKRPEDRFVSASAMRYALTALCEESGTMVDAFKSR